MSENINVPKLRFPEFLEPFERVSLKSLILNLDSGVSVNSESDKSALHGKAGVLKTSCVSFGKFFPEENKLIVEEEIDRAKLSPKKGTIIISRMNTPALVGESGFVPDNFENLFLPDRLWLAIPNEIVSDPKYLSITLTTPKTRSEISLIGTGTSGSMKNISKPNFLGLEIYLPSLPEQQKIAEFLTAVDWRVELLQAKKEKLEAYKKGVMQQIFSQKLRFTADEGSDFPDWEEKKLGDLGSVYQPKTISQSDLTEEGYDVFGANGIIGKYHSYNHEFPQIAVTCRGNTCGTINWTSPKSWITGNAMVVNTDENPSINKRFLFYIMTFSDLKYLITGSGQPQITGNLKNHKLQLPILEEQKKIVQFLTSLDGCIENLNQQINHTQTWKKGLLQQMFV